MFGCGFRFQSDCNAGKKEIMNDNKYDTDIFSFFSNHTNLQNLFIYELLEGSFALLLKYKQIEASIAPASMSISGMS